MTDPQLTATRRHIALQFATALLCALALLLTA